MGVTRRELASVTQERVEAAVRVVWDRMLVPGSYATGMGFDVAGGDSLRLLKFVFFLEQELQTELPLDLFTAIMRPEDAVRSVTRHLAGAEPFMPAATMLVHLLPGLSRDEQRLVRFREALAGDMSVRAVDYGDWQHWTTPGFGPEGLVARVVEDIAATQPDGVLWLLGYSVGGHVGFAAVQRLRAMGRTVGLLGILDTNLSEHPHSGFRTGRHDSAAERARILRGLRTGEAAAPVAEFAARRLLGPRWSPVLRTLARHRHARLPGELGFHLHDRLRARRLLELVGPLRPGAQDAGALAGVPVCVFRAREQEWLAAPDLGWRRYCPEVRLVAVDGGHHTMLDPPHLDGLVHAVRQEFGAAM